METIELRATVKNGNLEIYNKKYITHLLDKLEGKPLALVIGLNSPKRSVQQNRWYWGVAIPCVLENLKEMTGTVYEKEEINDYNISQILRPSLTTKDVLGQSIISYKSKRTSEMNVKEFNSFKEELQAHWAERGVVIPDPNQKEFIND